MNEQEMTMLIEADQRSKSNGHRIDAIENDIKELKNEQKAIYSIAASVEVIASKIGGIEEKVDDTRKAVDEQARALCETERRITERAGQIEMAPYKQTSKNVNSIRVAIITAVCTFIATGAAAAIVSLIK